jgi:hypothetical protein
MTLTEKLNKLITTYSIQVTLDTIPKTSTLVYTFTFNDKSLRMLATMLQGKTDAEQDTALKTVVEYFKVAK